MAGSREEVSGLSPDRYAHGALRIVFIYAAVSVLWIALSDHLITVLLEDPEQIIFVSTLKGWGFVGITALILFGLICQLVGRLEARERALRAEQAARQRTLDLLHTIVEGSTDAIFVKDWEGRYQLANAAMGAMIGRDPADILGRDDHALMWAEEAERVIARDRAIMEGGRVTTGEVAFRLPQGRRTHLVTKGPVRDERGVVNGLFAIARDITERKAAEERLRESEALYRSLFEHMLGGFAFFEAVREGGRIADFRFLAVNGEFETLSGLSDPVGLGLFAVLPDLRLADPDLVDLMCRVVNTGAAVRSERRLEAFGKWVLISAYRPAEGRLALLLEDVSDRKEAQSRIEFLAYHDPLTGLPNPTVTAERLALACAGADLAGAKVGVLFLDLDRFKLVNDTLGHALGDTLLCDVAARLRGCVGPADTVGRRGGDEFIVVLAAQPNAEAIGAAAEALMARIAEPFVLSDETVSTSVSVGIAVYPDDGRDFEILLRKADKAMRHAKEAGRNTHRFFDAAMHGRSEEYLRLRHHLARALERGELALHYQPQIDLRSGRITGAEALLRWTHAELGALSPARFIPVAEDSGLIVPIGEWVLQEACRQAAAWRSRGLPPVTVAVNLSALQFRSGKVERTVARALEGAALDPAVLELELTETVLLGDAEGVLKAVRRLKDLGVSLSIDDFGTGYSSLAYVKRFKVDKLKIDQSFVRDLTADQDSAAIVRAIVQMARGLNLATVAEGVEDGRTLEELRRFGCDAAQGFLFAPALPPDRFAAFLVDGALTNGVGHA